MKELSIEQKAKAYDEAIEKAKTWQEHLYDVNDKDYADELNYIFPELQESKDERIRKALIEMVHDTTGDALWVDYNVHKEECIAWLEKQKTSDKALQYLKEKHSPSEVSDFQAAMNIAVAKAYDKGYNDELEKQAEYANFRNKIQIGDKVTRNRDGVLVNLSQLNRVAKKDENTDKQGEQKPVDKVEPKFREGEWVVNTIGTLNQVVKVWDDGYTLDDNTFLSNSWATEHYHLWDIAKDAKDGDVLACPNDAGDRDVVFIFKNINSDEGWVFCFCASDANGCFCTNNDYVGNSNSTNISPATKEQRDLFFQKMKEAGYEWDVEKKKLKRIEQKNEIPKSHWKPSDEQIHWLKWVINCMPDTEKANEAKAVLEELLEQLRKLIEE